MSDLENLVKLFDEKYPAVEESVVDEIKKQYAHLIHSNRRLESIVKVSDIIRLLYKRDELHDANLHDIEAKLTKTTSRNISSLPLTINANYVNLHTPITYNASPKADLSRIYDYIADHIGPHYLWNFARNLNVPEGLIDELQKRKSYKESVKRILGYHEKYCDKYDWRRELLGALEKSRRNDMRNYVEKMLDRSNIIRPC